MNKNKNLVTATEIAQFRFALIAPVIQDLYPDASRTAYYKRVTEKPLTLPDGSVREISFKTLEKWVSNYQRFGFDALMPNERSDKGSTRVLSDAAIEEIYQLKKDFPRLNATQIYDRLIQNGTLSPAVSVCAVQRFIKRNDLKSARNPNMRDRKAFEEDAFGNMWQTDTCYFPYITEDGKSHRVYAICIIDDHSRLIVGAGLFYADSAANFQKVFKDTLCGLFRMVRVSFHRLAGGRGCAEGAALAEDPRGRAPGKFSEADKPSGLSASGAMWLATLRNLPNYPEPI